MQLIHALASGIAGAESGTAYIYRRGTSTLVTYYTDFEATAGLAQGASGISLDAYGSAVVYVDDMCTVVVKSSAGNTVRTFTAGNKDSAIEVISDSFTGSDYSTGTSGVSKPTTLQSVLDRWNDSAGTSNFQVLVGGSAMNIQDAISGLTGVFFNVKGTGYEATGDGTTDDYASCQAAIDAAEDAGGGIVFFPAGTYRLTQMLTVPYTVSIMGSGPECTHVKLDAATASGYSAFHFAGTTSTHYRFQRMCDLRVSCAQINSEEAVRVTDAFLIIENVNFVGHTLGFTGKFLENGTSPTAYHVILRSCSLELAASNNGGAISMSSPSSSGELELYGIRVRHTNTSFNNSAMIDVNGSATILRANSCLIDITAATTVNTGAVFSGEGKMYIHGCTLRAPTNNGASFIDVTDVDATTGFACESGNYVENSNNNLYLSAGFAASTLQDQVELRSRATRYKTTSTTAASLSLDPLERGVEKVVKTSGTTLTVNSATGVIPLGHRYTLIVWADNLGGALTVTLGTGFKGANLTVADNTVQTVDFIASAGPAGTIYLYAVAAATGTAE